MKKRYVIEFTVEAEDCPDEWIKDQALQELTCMSPFPEDIDFHIKGNPWHTGTPSKNGKYLVQYKTGFMEFLFYRDGKWLAKETVETMWGERLKTKREDVTDLVVAWQRIEPFKETIE